MNSQLKWRRFEKLATEIQRELSPNAKVTHDDKIMGHTSKRLRQVDITIKQKVGQFDLLVAIDCKDYVRPVNVGDIDKSIGLFKDIQANKGAIIAANGFSETALKVGRSAGLDLYRLIDAEAHEWQAYVSIPVLCDFRRIQKYRFHIPSSVGQFLPSMHPSEIAVYGHEINGKKQVTLTTLLQHRWNTAKLPSEVGEHKKVPIIKVKTGLSSEDGTTEDTVFADLIVVNRLFFGQLPLVKIKGLHDELTGRVLTPGFTTDYLVAKDVEQYWQQLNNINELAVIPFFTLVALDKFDIE